MSRVLRITSTTLGIYAGLLGMEHGVFETVQGNIVSGSLMIHAIRRRSAPGLKKREFMAPITISNNSWRNLHATRIIVSTVGILCGISGLEHGFFETLQGNTAPDSLLISAIGPANRFWSGGTETALTVIPNFFITGILAMLASLAVILWSAALIHKKHGASVFLLLSIIQFLVGGGFAQIFLVFMTAVAATQINFLWRRWDMLLPDVMRRFMARLWPWLLIIFTLSLCSAIFAAVFGFIPVVTSLFNLGKGDNFTKFLYLLGYFMLGALPLTILAGIAHDVEGRIYSGNTGMASE